MLIIDTANLISLLLQRNEYFIDEIMESKIEIK